jgi:hypothetical protein
MERRRCPINQRKRTHAMRVAHTVTGTPPICIQFKRRMLVGVLAVRRRTFLRASGAVQSIEPE